ncbi:MAG: rhomboid family intramembrane serine protease [Cyclobacteriaceae bacterium]|nr:rhomboid family intramembrane serine protease [Cyclobacteriaceae bacterium HetDA_MAG_MS6]
MFGRITPMVKNILIINIGIYLLDVFLKLELIDFFGLRVIFSEEFHPHQFLTYMWLHSTTSFYHLFGNMFAVFIFGPMLEQVWGSKRFLTFYLACGIGAGVLFGAADFFEKRSLKVDTEIYLENPNPEAFEIFILKHRVSYGGLSQLADFSDDFYENANNNFYISQSKEYVQQIFDLFSNIPMVGASGAVFGILMAFGMLFPNTQLMLLFPPIPIKAKYLVFFYGAYELYAEISRSPGDNVAHLAHLGGMLVAFILLRLWQKDTRRFY